jgi:Rab GDP dissociation inhibitor
MGIFEKRRFRNFLVWVSQADELSVRHAYMWQLNDFDQDKPATWKEVNPYQTTMAQVYTKFGLDDNTADFTGTRMSVGIHVLLF